MYDTQIYTLVAWVLYNVKEPTIQAWQMYGVQTYVIKTCLFNTKQLNRYKYLTIPYATKTIDMLIFLKLYRRDMYTNATIWRHLMLTISWRYHYLWMAYSA